MTPGYAHGYAQVTVRGADAFDFLQGQLTNDLRRLERDDRLLAAWCNPKGRVIALLRVARDPDGYRLGLPAVLAEPVARRMATFRFRARVEFEVSPADVALLAGSDSADFDLAAWRLHNLRAGVAEIAEAQSELYTPHMLNLDRLDALSLDKGCYTGQEIVARTHYRGATRRRLLRFRAEQAAAPGDEVFSGERKAGEVVNAIDNDLLAVVPLDVEPDAFTLAGTSLEALPLPYALD